MYTLPKPLIARGELLEKGIHIFTPIEFERTFNLAKYQTKYFLEEQSRKGLLKRLKKGLYALQTDLPNETEIANRLYQPSYISFEYALARYNILPEMVYEITSATTKPTRIFTINNKVFSYLTIKKETYTGYLLERLDVGRSTLIAEAEKALIDYLYFVSLGKKPFNDRLKITSVNKTKLYKYASLYNRKKINQLIEKLL